MRPFLLPCCFWQAGTTKVYNPNKTAAQQQADIAFCSDEANRKFWMDSIAALYNAYDCLEAKGYTREQPALAAELERARSAALRPRSRGLFTRARSPAVSAAEPELFPGELPIAGTGPARRALGSRNSERRWLVDRARAQARDFSTWRGLDGRYWDRDEDRGGSNQWRGSEGGGRSSSIFGDNDRGGPRGRQAADARRRGSRIFPAGRRTGALRSATPKIAGIEPDKAGATDMIAPSPWGGGDWAGSYGGSPGGPRGGEGPGQSHYGSEHGFGGFQGDYSGGAGQGGFGGEGDYRGGRRNFSGGMQGQGAAAPASIRTIITAAGVRGRSSRWTANMRNIAATGSRASTPISPAGGKVVRRRAAAALWQAWGRAAPPA